MTTYIKKITMVPVNTIKEHHDTFINEMELLEDMTNSLKDIIQTMDNKDEECLMSEELGELDQLRMDLRDTIVNINKIVVSYVKILKESTNE
jgi:hypothetical protein